MVIGIDASRANRENKTGVEWYSWHIIQHLKKEIPDAIRVVLYSENPLVGELADLPKNWESKVLNWPPKKMWTQIRLSFEMLVNPPDVLFVPSHVFPIIHPKKTIMTVHDIAAIKFPQGYNKFQAWYTVWSAKFAVKKLWKVIVPSFFTKKEMMNYWRLADKKTDEKINVIAHGYDKIYQKNYQPEKNAQVLKKYNLQGKYFLAVGRLEEKKNTRRVVQAFNHFVQNSSDKDYKLVLSGVPGFGFEKVQKAIEDSPYKKNIICLGWVEREDLSYILNSAKSLLFVSLYEGFGMPALEAMACGVPVIASKKSCVEEISGECCVYVDPQNVWEISKAMSDILNDEKLRIEKIRCGLERVKNFSWDNCAQKTAKLLLE